MNAKEFIKHLLSIENYSFSLEEITQHTDGKGTSLKFELARLIDKKEIVNLRKGFYLIIPPRYSKQGQLPIQLYIDKLFKSLNRNYYLGFYSAAKFHGASHQQAQREYVMIEKPKLNDIEKNDLNIRFFTTSNWSNKNILEKKSDAGIFKISSPALTAVDLIHHQTKLGGLNRMLAILEELSEEIDQNDIAELLTWYPHKSTLQRFGFLLEELQVDKNLSKQVMEYLQQSKYFPVLLSPKTKQKAGAVNNIWKVDVNIKLESDL
ncbi:MAG: type IV toxin-antitoxin system AbiEi family antitoxin [Flavobacteriaceae bacterium]|nr:type IV toxin-antitoxin system AbiEi family antitoxin [Flavobacteriaceae bacterium]